MACIAIIFTPGNGADKNDNLGQFQWHPVWILNNILNHPCTFFTTDIIEVCFLSDSAWKDDKY